tara:strand:- start:43 stop:672 length:630 start_codon:yes stop_codon:yes gene_type:complete
MKILDTNAYVYIWFSPDWIPFYVGMGKTPTRWNPLRIKKKDRNPLVFSMVAKFGADKVRVQRLTKLTWEDAQALECSLIAHFKRKSDGGPLVNFTDGGDGVSSPSPEVSEAKRQKLLDPKNPIREYHKILNTDPDIKKRRVEGIKAAQPKRAEKMRDPAALAQRKERLKATMNSPEYLTKRALWDTPEYRAKLSAAKTEYWAKRKAVIT